MRTVPRLVWLLTVLSFLMSLSSSLVIPTYFGFDEPQHVDMVVAIEHGDGWADPGERHLAWGVRRTSDLYYNPGSNTRPLDMGLRTIAPRGQRPSLQEAGGFDQSTGGLPNQIVQHPPLYYALVAAGVTLVDADDWSYDRLVAFMRVLTALMAAGIPLLTWAICRRLGASEAVGVAAAAMTLAVPGLTRITGMVSNDAFMVLTATALLLGLVHVATGDLSRRTGLLVGGLTAAALLTKGFGLPLPLLVVVAYVIGWRRAEQPRPSKQQALVPLGLALAVAFVFGGLWWLRNLIAFGAIQPNGYGAASVGKVLDRPHPHAGGPLHSYVSGVADLLARSFWGGAGTTSAPSFAKTFAIWLSLLVLVAVVAGIACGVRGSGHRGALLLLVLPMALALVIVVQGSWPIYHDRGQIRGVHGRYLYLAIPGLAVCVAVAGERLLARARSFLPALVIALLIAVQAVGAERLVKRLWFAPGRTNSMGGALRHLQVLSPYPTLLTEAVFGITALVVALALALACLEGLRGLTRSDREAASLPA